jgi:hypothetical protein
LSTEALTPEILRGGEVSARRFDPRSVAPFVNKSVSEETRRTYRRSVSEFFQSAGMQMPKPKDPNTGLRYDHGRENMGQNAVNFLGYEEEG